MDKITIQDMIDKLGLEKKPKLFLFIVILCKYILPILIASIVATILRVAFSYIDSILFNDFLAGWISYAVWDYYNSYYAR